MAIENEQEFREWCRINGLKDKPIKNYVSWLNMASRRIDEDITSQSLSSEADIVKMLATLNQHPDMTDLHPRRLQDTKAAMKMYLGMCCKNENTIEALRPFSKPNIIDLLVEAGVDVTDWSNYRGGADRAATNPRYCYRWSFYEPGKVVVLSIWFEDLKIENGVIYQDRNIRRIGLDLTGPSKTRALEMDHDIQIAWETKTPIRVIICDRHPGVPTRITRRMLDVYPWSLRFYNVETGQCRLERDYSTQRFVDQFSIPECQDQEVSRRDRTGTEHVRKPEVRNYALERSQGKCEYCGEAGFLMASGQIYLESHHIIPLSEDGPDSTNNVVALCPNHHRQAHYGANREEIKKKLQQKTLNN